MLGVRVGSDDVKGKVEVGKQLWQREMATTYMLAFGGHRSMTGVQVTWSQLAIATQGYRMEQDRNHHYDTTNLSCSRSWPHAQKHNFDTTVSGITNSAWIMNQFSTQPQPLLLPWLPHRPHRRWPRSLQSRSETWAYTLGLSAILVAVESRMASPLLLPSVSI